MAQAICFAFQSVWTRLHRIYNCLSKFRSRDEQRSEIAKNMVWSVLFEFSGPIVVEGDRKTTLHIKT